MSIDVNNEDLVERVHALETALAVSQAVQTGADATLAATQAGVASTTAAAAAGTWSTMVASAAGLLAGFFLGKTVVRS